jgi:Mce-associated membrane protein
MRQLAAKIRNRLRVKPRKREHPARRNRLVGVLAVAALLATAAAGAGWYGHHRAQQRDAAVRQALAAASAAARAIFSYDYRTFDTSVTNGRTFATGAFAEEYAQTTAALKATAVSEKAVVLAEVSSTGVISASREEVELLLYLNQYRRNVNTAGEKVDQNRVVFTMTPVDGEWKVSRATAI